MLFLEKIYLRFKKERSEKIMKNREKMKN